MSHSNNATVMCLGHNENALLFNASGIQGIIIKDEKDLALQVEKYVEQGIKIFLVSEVFSEEIERLREKYNAVYPIFLLLSLDGSTTDAHVERIRKDVERATGINLL
ncbi:MAG TPA: V-type ATP synthase subunit F [Haploplasma sp.]|nr:V-type ATP synthase subunit F [Haploplasma sp.]